MCAVMHEPFDIIWPKLDWTCVEAIDIKLIEDDGSTFHFVMPNFGKLTYTLGDNEYETPCDDSED